jgi:hypothetical protein
MGTAGRKRKRKDRLGRHGRNIGYEVSAAPILYCPLHPQNIQFTVLKCLARRTVSA